MKRDRAVALFSVFVLLLIIVLVGCSSETNPLGVDVKPARIVSTAPSITETLFAIGLGDNVVAISDYCRLPEGAPALPRIGSLNEFNIEAIVGMKPDLVVVLKENEILKQRLSNLGVEILELDHSSLKGVMNSFEEVGARLEEVIPDALEKGRALRRDLEGRIEAVRCKRTDDSPRVLISIYRTRMVDRIGEIYIAGRNPYYDEILEIVGAKNAAESESSAVPIINEEGVIALAPDVIIDLSTDGDVESEAVLTETQKRREDWYSLGTSVPAVASGRIYPLLERDMTVPGPRTVDFIERLAELLRSTNNEQ